MQVMVSDMIKPSLIQRFGYTAAITAATMPTRSPPSRRPSSPISATSNVPSNAMK